jgi:DNA sulfur modification protein DndC
VSPSSSSGRTSAFNEQGLQKTIDNIVEHLQALYRADKDPWVIGYSGGKDSTAVVQLVWLAISQLPSDEVQKPVFVVTTDTLVENPIVSTWVENSLKEMSVAANKCGLPIQANLLKPKLEGRFWINLIGKGYPAPRHKFRWCTERLKINPTTEFIQNQISSFGEVVLFLGTRRAESTVRAARLDRQEDVKDQLGLTPHPDLHGCWVYSPIANWSNDDVWTFLTQMENPWGYDNHDLLALYRGATADNECPVVVDTSTPSCGTSRFGCWVCTLVDQDKSMSAMIQNDYEKEWMLPLLELRNELDFREEDARKLDRQRRDFRRIRGNITHYRDRDDEVQLVPGPYTQNSRAYWLKRLMETQKVIQQNPITPDSLKTWKLLELEDLEEIRRIWLEDKREIEDLLPQIYEEVFEKPYPGEKRDDRRVFDSEALSLLKSQCSEEPLIYELARNLLDVEWEYRLHGKRKGLFDQLEKQIRRCYYDNEEDALNLQKRKLKLEEGEEQFEQAQTSSSIEENSQ